MAIIKDAALLTNFFKNHKIDFDDPALFKDLYKPITQQLFDHRVDALTYSLRQTRSEYDARRTDEQKRRERDVYREVGSYIDPLRPKSAYDLLFNPEVIDKFLWGPHGEFIGFVKSAEMEQQFNRSPTGKMSVDRKFTLNMEIELIGYDGELIGWGHPQFHQLFGMHYNNYHGRRDHCPQLVRFSSYHEMVEYHSYYHGDIGRANSITIPVHELAGLIQNLRPVQNSITDWMNALGKAKADYGFGCLRDGEGNMDPLGVLADINGCEWVWDRREGAYKIKGGDAYTLPDKLLREYLGVPDDVAERHVKEFQTAIPGMVDRCTTYQQVIDMLRKALDLSAWRLNDLREWRTKDVGGAVFRGIGDPSAHDEVVMYQPSPMPRLGGDGDDYYTVRRPTIGMMRDWSA
jgi:hypothetical protein